MQLRSNGELESSLSPGPKTLTAKAPPSTGPPPLGGSREYDPTQAWLRRERRRLHTHGIGSGGQQLRPRHLALLDRYVPAWDSKWHRMLTACRKYLRTKGKLPRDGPKQVAAVCEQGAGAGAAHCVPRCRSYAIVNGLQMYAQHTCMHDLDEGAVAASELVLLSNAAKVRRVGSCLHFVTPVRVCGGM